MLEPIPFAGMVDIDMNNVPVALTQGDILGILQDANSVPLGQPIFNSSEEYNKLKAIIESAIRYTHPAKPIDKPDECISGCPENQTCDYCAGIKTLTDEEIVAIFTYEYGKSDYYSDTHQWAIEFARAILQMASEK